jgi:hypothetical protein
VGNVLISECVDDKELYVFEKIVEIVDGCDCIFVGVCSGVEQRAGVKRWYVI